MLDKLTTQIVDIMPMKLDDGIIYISPRFGTAIHNCACGCGISTVTPFKGLHCWTLTYEPNGVTLSPSIGNQQFPCKSHYFIRNGKVIPC